LVTGPRSADAAIGSVRFEQAAPVFATASADDPACYGGAAGGLVVDGRQLACAGPRPRRRSKDGAPRKLLGIERREHEFVSCPGTNPC